MAKGRTEEQRQRSRDLRQGGFLGVGVGLGQLGEGLEIAGIGTKAQQKAMAGLIKTTRGLSLIAKGHVGILEDQREATLNLTKSLVKNRLRYTELFSQMRIGWGVMKSLGRGMREFTELAGKQAQAEARLEAVLRATGGAAGYTAQQLGRHADALQELTEIDDQAVLSVQAMLATFKEIRGPEFKRATEAVLDMSIILGDTKSAAVQVGKALNDPIKGVTALGRAGVQFTEQQKEQIKQLLYSGQTVKAQQMILKELESQFGGTARAASEAGAGWERLTNAAQDFGEMASKNVLPQIQEMNKGLAEMLRSFEKAARDPTSWLSRRLKNLGETAAEVGAIAAGYPAGRWRAHKIKTGPATLAERAAFAKEARRRQAIDRPPARTKFAPPGKKFAPKVVSGDVAWKMLSTSQVSLVTLGEKAVHEAMTANEWLAEIAKNQKAFAAAPAAKPLVGPHGRLAPQQLSQWGK